jgi:hypothetical protein
MRQFSSANEITPESRDVGGIIFSSRLDSVAVTQQSTRQFVSISEPPPGEESVVENAH